MIDADPQTEGPVCRWEAADGRLTRFERRLLRRLGECQEALQLAILGADRVCERGRDTDVLAVCRMLDEAQSLVEHARSLTQASLG